MRILLVHNRYQEGGGEDVVFEEEAGLLEAVATPSPGLSSTMRRSPTSEPP